MSGCYLTIRDSVEWLLYAYACMCIIHLCTQMFNDGSKIIKLTYQCTTHAYIYMYIYMSHKLPTNLSNPPHHTHTIIIPYSTLPAPNIYQHV